MDTLPWDTVHAEFGFDGSWRDIVVADTDMAAWQRMLDGLRNANYQMQYLRDGQSANLPADAALAHPLPGEGVRHLSIRFAEVLANCYFFTPEEIEFDIDPREVKGQAQLDALFGFMRCIADSVGKDTVLTPENVHNVVIFRVRPRQTGIEYHAVGGWHD